MFQTLVIPLSQMKARYCALDFWADSSGNSVNIFLKILAILHFHLGTKFSQHAWHHFVLLTKNLHCCCYNSFPLIFCVDISCCPVFLPLPLIHFTKWKHYFLWWRLLQHRCSCGFVRFIPFSWDHFVWFFKQPDIF